MDGLPAYDPMRDPPVVAHELLHADVAKARTHGVGKRSKPLRALPSLLSVATWVSPQADDEDKIEDLLRRAVARLGGQTYLAMEALFGLTAETRGEEVQFRRQIAAQLYDHKAYDSFRAHYETQLLLAVTNQLYILIAERFLLRYLPVKEWPRTLLDNGWGAGVPGYDKKDALTIFD